MNLRVARGMDDYILRTRTPKLSETIQKILRPHPELSKQCETYNMYDVYFLLRQKIDGIPEPQKSQIVANWRSSSIAMRKSFNYLKQQESSYFLSLRTRFRSLKSSPETAKGDLARQLKTAPLSTHLGNQSILSSSRLITEPTLSLLLPIQRLCRGNPSKLVHSNRRQRETCPGQQRHLHRRWPKVVGDCFKRILYDQLSGQSFVLLKTPGL